MILLCVHGVFKEKFKFTVMNILLILLDMIVMVLIYAEFVGQLTICVVYFLLFLYCIRKFHRKFLEIAGRLMLALVIAGLIELLASIVGMVFGYVLKTEESSNILLVSENTH